MFKTITILFKAICVIIIACQLVTAQDSREGDSLALQAIQTANGALGWDPAQPINTYSGVTAGSGSTDRVTILYLGNKNLGVLPAEIGNLTKLTSLGLNNNMISIMPAEIGALTELTELVFENNSLSTIPAEIGSLTNLVYLFLNGNIIEQLPPEIGSLSNLQDLWLDNNFLTSLPTEMGTLSSLTICSLDKNKLHFDDIELLYGKIDELYYEPQNTIGTASTDSLIPGLKIGIVVRGSANHYTWTLDDDTVGEDSDSITVTEAGVYTCTITSDSITDLALTHEPITVKGPTPIINNKSILPGFDLFTVSNSRNPVLTINYHLSILSQVELTVYSISGQTVGTLVSQQQPSGNYRYAWDSRGYAKGTYFCVLTAGDVVRVKKLLLFE